MHARALSVLVLAGVLPCQTFFPPPPAPSQNPVTPEKALLGMALFWEEQMSADDTMACGTCHGFQRGGSEARAITAVHPGPDNLFGTPDDRRGSQGVTNRSAGGSIEPGVFGYAPQVTPRKAPSVVNAAYNTRLFYDGRARDGDFRDPVTNVVVATGAVALENLMLQPPLNPVEMGHPGRTWNDVTAKLAASTPLRLASNLPQRLTAFVNGRSYPDLFQAAFGTPDVTASRVAMALATYLRTLVADRSRFDQFVRNATMLTAQELRGRDLFNAPHGTAAACVQCHGDVAASSHATGPSHAVTTMYGTQPRGNFHNVGIRPIAEDPGAFVVTNQPADQGRFKVPMLRNVDLHARFGHNGGMATLAEVIDLYDRGGDFHVNQAPEIQPRNMPQADKDALVAFLRTLTDSRVAAGVPPFDSPTLASESNAQRPQVFGVGTPGWSQVEPQVIARQPIYRGSPRVEIGLGNASPQSLAFLLFDTQVVAGGFATFGPRLYTPAPAIVGVGTTNASAAHGGYASAAFPVPADPQLAGLRMFAQWVVLDPQGPNGASASRPLQIDLQ